MQRVSFLFFLVAFSIPAGGSGQDAAWLALREPQWHRDNYGSGKRFRLTGLARQFFCTSEWNVAGLGFSYQAREGASSLFILRDGIPSFSWYHLYLSHSQSFNKITTILQLRFSGILVADRPPAFRLGGNLGIDLPVGGFTRIGLTVWDFPGFLFPRAALARGDPMIRLQTSHSPGRQLDLLWALDLSPAHPGPLYMGVRMRINDQLSLLGLAQILQPGFTLGISWNLRGTQLVFLTDEGSGVGLTPTIVAGGEVGGGG